MCMISVICLKLVSGFILSIYSCSLRVVLMSGQLTVVLPRTRAWEIVSCRLMLHFIMLRHLPLLAFKMVSKDNIEIQTKIMSFLVQSKNTQISRLPLSCKQAPNCKASLYVINVTDILYCELFLG
jgi:hypothetical protein